MPPARPPARGSALSLLGRGVAVLTTLVNLVLLVVVLGMVLSLASLGSGDHKLTEHLYSGKAGARDKIAVIRIEGVLYEGLTGYALKQIDAAAEDDAVKAVVLRITSPGGTITASDQLHRRLQELRDGTLLHHPGKPKRVVVSMGSVAASGGYYIAMIKGPPDEPTPVLAEPTTITGSIGVYAALPNVKKLADNIGVSMNVIKAGDIKDSGSPFENMTAHERLVWQRMVDQAYLRFLQVVEEGRPQLKGKLQEDVTVKETLPVRRGPDKETHLDYTRYRADGGIFTAEQAVSPAFGLIDQIGYLDDAVEKARQLAGLADARVITYDRPPSLVRALLGAKAPQPALQLDPQRLAAGAESRLWYLLPQSDLAGLLTAVGR
jgi:protease-4